MTTKHPSLAKYDALNGKGLLSRVAQKAAAEKAKLKKFHELFDAEEARELARTKRAKKVVANNSPGKRKTVKARTVAEKSLVAANRLLNGHSILSEDDLKLPDHATPLDVMMQAMRKAYQTGGAMAAFPFARECAPYMHARISSMTLKPGGSEQAQITRIVREILPAPVDVADLLGDTPVRVVEEFTDVTPNE